MVTDGILFTVCVVVFCIARKAEAESSPADAVVVLTITRNTNLITDIAVVSTGDLLCVAADANAVYRVATSSSSGQSAAQLVADDPDSPPDFVNGVGINARFFNPYGIAFDMNRSTAYISDYNNNCIRALQLPMYNVTTLSGTCGSSIGNSGTGEFSGPWGVAYRPMTDTLYVVDSAHHRICSIPIAASNGSCMLLAKVLGSSSQQVAQNNVALSIE